MFSVPAGVATDAVARDLHAIAAVEHGQQATERHQQAAAPDPVDEGLVIDAHGPFGVRLVACRSARRARHRRRAVKPASIAASVIGIAEEW